MVPAALGTGVMTGLRVTDTDTLPHAPVPVAVYVLGVVTVATTDVPVVVFKPVDGLHVQDV